MFVENGGFILSGIVFVIGCRLSGLQTSSDTRILAEGQQIRTSNATTDRRRIKDRNQLVSAIDTTTQDVYVHPVLCKRSLADLSTELSVILGIPIERLLEKLHIV